MAFNRYGPHTFYYDYDLERGDECLPVEVTYVFEDESIWIESVKHNGVELETTEEEDRELRDYAYEQVNEDMMDAEADYGDYLHDMRRDMED